MKTLGIDARLYVQTGVGIYLHNLLSFLPDLREQGIEITLYMSAADRSQIPDYLYKRYTIVLVPEQWHSWEEQFTFWYRLYRAQHDLVHFPYFSYPVLYRRPFVATVHDLTPLFFRTGKASTHNPLFYSFKHAVFRWVLASEVQHARHIFTPTQTVRDMICRTYGKVYETKITPTYEGVHQDMLNLHESVPRSAQVSGRYLLYVGNFYPHKNISRLLRAFRSVEQEGVLVLAGPRSFFLGEIQEEIKDAQVTERVQIVEHPSLEELVSLYTYATALVHPSLSEGFGLPIVEAMHFGLPIVASDIAVFREILGDRYTSFSPTDEESMTKGISEILAQDDRRVDYADLLGRFSFPRMAEQTAAVYVRLLS